MEQQKKKIGIIGSGNVGQALARGLKRVGHDVRVAGHDEKIVRETGEWAEIVFLAVPFRAIDDTLRELGEAIDGKPLVDVTNALGPDMNLALGFTTSGAEELQKKVKDARVVKAFNTVFAQHMDKGQLNGKPLTAFVASDDDAAKRDIMQLALDIGFDAVDAGPLKSARSLEPLAVLNIQLGYALKMGTQIGFELVH